MRNYQTKSNQGALPDSITSTRFGAGEFNSVAVELEGAVTTSGQTLAPADGTGEVTDQLSMALAIYGAGGATYHVDTGVVNAYVLTPVSPKESPNALFNGFSVVFEPGTVNTTASTVNVGGLGVKSITLQNGTALSGGELSGTCCLKYNLSDDRFELIYSSDSFLSISNYYEIDATQVDQGATSTNSETMTIYDVATLVGTSKFATVHLSHNPSAGNQTLYTFDTTLDLSSYPFLFFNLDPGAQFDRTTGDELLTIYNPSNFDAKKNQLITSVDMLRFANDGDVYPEWWGAVADGSTDCQDAIQWSLENGKRSHLSVGTYLVGGEIYLVDGSKIYGSGNYSGIATLTVYPTGLYSGTTVIQYNGPTGANYCVIRASKAIVGTEPADSATRNLLNIAIQDIVIDGDGKAGIGLYCVRAFKNNCLDRITVTNTTDHAFLCILNFGGIINHWDAFINEGAGITLGRDLYTWTAYTVDQTVFNSCYAYYNGHNASRTSLNVFQEGVSEDVEYGIGVFGFARGLQFNNLQTANNGGAGLYVEHEIGPFYVATAYMEQNCQSTNATGQWGIWFEGESGGQSWGAVFENIAMQLGDNIRLTGTEPSRIENGPLFKNIPYVDIITADWENYRLFDVNRNVSISSTAPNGLKHRFNESLNSNISGFVTFNVSGSAIGGLNVDGVVTNASYTSTGTYAITISPVVDSTAYAVQITGSDNRIGGIANRTTSGFDIVFRDNTGALSDSSIVTAILIGFYQ